MKTFYDHQEKARGNSAALMSLLTLAIGVTTLVTGLMVTLSTFVPLYWLFIKAFPRPEMAFTIHLHPDRFHPVQRYLVDCFPWMVDFPWELFGFFYLVITISVGSAIAIATRNKLRRLWEAGGVGVAESLGGICVSADEYRKDERTQRAVNVVNEIAVASRIPPPHVYLLHDEPGINAFAVGLTARDMVIGMTHGCIANLNREQLQCVVAHEVAHITNGDTKTNVLLVGYLHGLMTVVISAQSLMSNGFEMMVKSIAHGGHGLTGMFFIAKGALLWPVGLIGLFGATAVKAAYSRQREYLADASAIEFTRNQGGLLSAMKRILGSQHGSRVRSPRCLAISHVFFAKSSTGLLGLVDSHPPLAHRIKRIDSSWNGEVEHEAEHDVGQFNGVFSGTMSIEQRARGTTSGRLAQIPTADFTELEIDDSVVMNVNEHAANVREMIPAPLWAFTQDLPSAQAVVFALFAVGQTIESDDDVELDLLGQICGDSQTAADALKPHLESFGLAERLMLFDASVNVIREHCQKSDLSRFCEKAGSLLTDEDDSDLFRWSWRKTVQLIVDRELQVARPKPEFRDVDEVIVECAILLSALAYANDGVMEGYAMLRASNALGHDVELVPRDLCGLAQIDQVLERLKLLAPKARRKVVLACSASVETDSVMNEDEALLMRGICSALGYPPATLLPGQPITIA